MVSTLSNIRDSFRRRVVRMGVAEALAHAQVAVNNHERNIARGIAQLNSTTDVLTRIGRFYLRAGMRAIGTGDSYLITHSIELASIDIRPPYRRKGACAAVLDGLEDIGRQTNRIVYVENVLNPDLDRYLRNHRLYRPLYGVREGCETFWFDPKKPLCVTDSEG